MSTILFDVQSPEGKLASIFRCKDSFKSQKKLWTLSLPIVVGGGAYLHQIYGMMALQAYAPYLIVAPLLLRGFSHIIGNRRATKIVKEIFLMKNGDQIILQTIDGIYHKIWIQDIFNYKFIDSPKAQHVEIIIEWGNRKFSISTKHKEEINFEILDKIMKGVCIKTNGIKSKVRTPSNLKNECVVKVDSLKLLGLDQTASKQVLSPEEKDIKARLEKLGVHYCSDEAFYAAHKISRVDFINKVSELPEEQQQAEVLKLFDDRSTKGRKIDLSRIEKNIKKALEKTSGKATKTVYGLNNL